MVDVANVRHRVSQHAKLLAQWETKSARTQVKTVNSVFIKA